MNKKHVFCQINLDEIVLGGHYAEIKKVYSIFGVFANAGWLLDTYFSDMSWMSLYVDDFITFASQGFTDPRIE